MDLPKTASRNQPNRRAMNLKSQLKLYLELRGMTAAEVSRKSGVSKQVLSLWLTGSSPKNIEQVKKVAAVLGTSVDHLCFGEGKDVESEKVVELNHLMGNDWIS